MKKALWFIVLALLALPNLVGATDTLRSKSYLQTVFADNATKNITAQQLRDFLVSADLKAVTSKTADYTVTTDDQIIVVSGASATADITLYSPVSTNGAKIFVKCTSVLHTVRVLTAAGNIEGSASYTFSAANDGILCVSDGTNWKIVSRIKTVQTGDIAVGAITAATISASAVSTTAIANYAVTESKLYLANNTTYNVTSSAHGFQAKDAFALTGRQILTAGSGTYTPTAGTRACLIEVQGGGAGGGGGLGDTTKWGIGGGGGAGGYAKLLITAPEASYDYVVGAAANGGSAGNNSGTAGNVSTFSHHAGAAIITCNGGTAGTGGAAVSNAGNNYISDIRLPKAGGTATGGDTNISGGYSLPGILCLTAPYSGAGGASHLGMGGIFQTAIANGIAGSGYGSGGSGGYSNTSGGQSGGAGAAGLIIVWEFK